MRKQKIKPYVIALIMIMAIFFLILKQKQNLKAVFDSDKAVHINPSEIENSTLIIGSHLIHLSVINDEIYELAKKSAQDSSQGNIYYKSELGEGKWYNITFAEDLQDITRKGTPLDDNEINQLFMTHHTKSDGVTYDLISNQAVSIFDMKPLYDISELEELEPLLNHYNITDVKKSKTEINALFDKSLITEQTQLYDIEMAELLKYSLSLKEREVPTEWILCVEKIMGKIDSARRIIALNLAESYLAEIDQKADIDEGLLNAISESRKKLEESLLQYEGNILKEGETIISNKEYQLSLELINLAKIGEIQQEEGDFIVMESVNLLNIMNNKIISIPGDSRILDEVLSEMDLKFKENISRGEVFGISSNDRKEELEVFRNELEFYIQAKMDRMNEQDALDFLGECMINAGIYKQMIKDDNMKKDSQNIVESHSKNLATLMSSIEVSGEKSEIQILEEEKKLLEEKMRGAMDENLIDEAKRYEAIVIEKDQEIKKLEEMIAKELDSLNKRKETAEKNGSNTGDIDRQIALLERKLQDDGEGKNIQEMKQKALEILRDGNVQEVEKDSLLLQIEGLGSLLTTGSSSALKALKEIYKKTVSESFLNDNSQLEEVSDRIEELILESSIVEHEEVIESEDDTKKEEGEKIVYYITPTADYVRISEIAQYFQYRYIWSDSKKEATISKGGDFYQFTAFEKTYIHKGKDKLPLSQAVEFQTEILLPVAFVQEEFRCSIYPIEKTGYAYILKDDVLMTAEEKEERSKEKGGYDWQQ